MKRFRFAWVAAVVACAASVAGCSASVTTGSGKTLDQSDEIAFARNYIAHTYRDLPPTSSADCPGGVEAKVDATFNCQATLTNGQQLTLPVRLASWNGKHGKFAADLASVSQPLAVDLVYKSSDSPPKSVDCPTGVPATEGKTVDCKVTYKSGAETLTLKVEKATNTDQDLRVVAVHRG